MEAKCAQREKDACATGNGTPNSPDTAAKVVAQTIPAKDEKVEKESKPVKAAKGPKPGEGVMATPYFDDPSSEERKRKKKRVFVREGEREILREQRNPADEDEREERKEKKKEKEEKHDNVFDYKLDRTQGPDEDTKK
ncbi:unnamed protein product [Heligmosomoides polygyrus]|uniref:BLVR domain-containing protein n=1 Tax=Heligmosomoides polygyrus TaxID=6339 RepID=A0A183FPF2_HELPZ|nr:unnamed protein product [Heligmosomoides polygyrus]